MISGPKTHALLQRIDHPPTSRDMRHLCNALLRDDQLEQARELAERMLEYSTAAPGAYDEFYYWLGVTQALRAIADAKFDRWRRRVDRRAS